MTFGNIVRTAREYFVNRFFPVDKFLHAFSTVQSAFFGHCSFDGDEYEIFHPRESLNVPLNSIWFCLSTHIEDI